MEPQKANHGGLPENVWNGVIHLEIRNDATNVSCETGIQQGDNLAPNLFLCGMQAAFKLLEKKFSYLPFEFH